jgi:hypothetical protein
MSVQLVLGELGDEPYYIDFDQDNSMIAPLGFGSPAPGFDGGEVAMTKNYYDLDAVEYKEPPKSPPKKEEGFPWMILIPVIAILGLLAFLMYRRRQTANIPPP